MSPFRSQEIKQADCAAIRDACLLLRVVGGISAGVSAILLVSNIFAWLGMALKGSYDMMDTLTSSITGQTMRLIIFLFAYVIGTAVPVFVKPAKQTHQQIEEQK